MGEFILCTVWFCALGLSASESDARLPRCQTLVCFSVRRSSDSVSDARVQYRLSHPVIPPVFIIHNL
jgi:hypothetical protein